MKLLQKIASSAVGLSLLTIPGVSAKIDPSHDELKRALNDVGVEVFLNETELCDGSKYGMYSHVCGCGLVGKGCIIREC